MFSEAVAFDDEIDIFFFSSFNLSNSNQIVLGNSMSESKLMTYFLSLNPQNNWMKQVLVNFVNEGENQRLIRKVS